MVIHLACLSKLHRFSLRRASKIFVISSDCLLTSIQQVHDTSCSGLSSMKSETTRKKPKKKNKKTIKEYLRYSILLHIHPASVEQTRNV